jgi:exopolysaccharide biosynthesis polyprenyl glycosylphosphotransferase
MTARTGATDHTGLTSTLGNGRSDSGGSSNGTGSTGGAAPVPLSGADQRQARRFLRIARVGDTVIAVLVLLGGFLASNIDRMPGGLQDFLSIRITIRNFLLILGFAVVWRLICVLVGLYDEKLVGDRRGEMKRVFIAVTTGAVVALVFPMISVTEAFSHLAVLYYWVGSAAGLLLLRACGRAFVTSGSSRARDILIVGSGPRAVRLYRDLCEKRVIGCRLIGFVDTTNGDLTPDVQRQLLGDLDALEAILMRHAIDEVIIALPVRSRYAEIQRTIEICERGGVPAKYLADVFQHRRSDESMAADGLFTAVPPGLAPDDPRWLVKRCLDLSLGSLALVMVAPVLAAAAIAIKLTSSGPVLFPQERYGLNKRRFRMYKLRTMIADAEAQQESLEEQNEARGPVFKIRDDPRVTPVGRVLRRLSIDELPQLVNVIRGEMSLVGPRPLPLRDVSRFSEPALMRRFSVVPGITGLWQVSGRSNLGFEDWVRLDLRYIDEWSWSLEVQVLLRTVPAVLRGEGAM